MRSVIRFIALFLLTFVGSVDGVRTAVVPTLQACVCGCGAPSDDLCECKGPARPSTPPVGPKPCSEPIKGCSNTSGSTSQITAAKKAEDPAKDPEPKPEPHPWPLQVAQVERESAVSILRAGFDSFGNFPPPWRSLRRLAWLSVFRN